MNFLNSAEIIILAVCLYFITFWLYIYLWINKSPLKIFFSAIGGFLISPTRKYLFLLIFLMATNIIETKYDDDIAKIIGINLTDLIKNFEGDLVGRIQGWGEFFDYLFTYTYIFGFAAVCITPVIIFSATGSTLNLKKCAFGLWLNYLVALPFYLFFPVYEIWSVENSKYGTLIMNNLNPLIMQYYRPTSGINNCFPSFHTSCSIFSMYIAYVSANKIAKFFGLILGICVITSTFYLGIHWLTDVFAGLLVGIIICITVEKLIKR